jgi:O-antigen ligase
VCQVPSWWLCALLVAAPWAYGTTFPQTKQFLAVALVVLGGLFALSLIVQRRWPRGHWLSAVLTVVILAQGWLMTLNPKLAYDATVQYFHFVPGAIPWLPGTVDQSTSLGQMWLITGLLAAFWVVSDLGSEPVWRDRFMLVMSLTGVSLMALGLLQRVTGAPGILWRGDLDSGPTFFATYRYHANAGAFINICLLLIAARMLSVFRRDHSDLIRSFWVIAFMATVVSMFVNVSRVATLIGVVSVCVFFAWELRNRIAAKTMLLSRLRMIGFAVGAVIAAAFLVWAVGFNEAGRHWTELGRSLVSDARFVVYGAIACYLLPRSLGWGFGPGTFHLIFPFFTNSLGTSIRGYWEYAHEDYLETIVEWGLFGAAVWFVFFSAIIFRAVLRLRRRRRSWDSNTRRFAVACFLALGAVVVHATVDFPLQIASIQLYTAALLGSLAAWVRTGERRAASSRSESEARGN